MRSINKVILIGNLTRDPELRQTPNGQNVCTLGLATNRVWVTSDGIRQSSTEFHELVAWSRLAEICHKNLQKGKLIYVEGYLKTRSWDTPEGIRKFKTEIIIQDMIILEKRPKTEEIMKEGEYLSAESEQLTTDLNQKINNEKASGNTNKSNEDKKEESKGPQVDIGSELGL